MIKEKLSTGRAIGNRIVQNEFIYTADVTSDDRGVSRVALSRQLSESGNLQWAIMDWAERHEDALVNRAFDEPQAMAQALMNALWLAGVRPAEDVDPDRIDESKTPGYAYDLEYAKEWIWKSKLQNRKVPRHETKTGAYKDPFRAPRAEVHQQKLDDLIAAALQEIDSKSWIVSIHGLTGATCQTGEKYFVLASHGAKPEGHMPPATYSTPERAVEEWLASFWAHLGGQVGRTEEDMRVVHWCWPHRLEIKQDENGMYWAQSRICVGAALHIPEAAFSMKEPDTSRPAIDHRERYGTIEV